MQTRSHVRTNDQATRTAVHPLDARDWLRAPESMTD